MENKIVGKIGSLIIATVENDFRENTQNNYTLSDFIEDFEGTEEELHIALIKQAVTLL